MGCDRIRRRGDEIWLESWQILEMDLGRREKEGICFWGGARMTLNSSITRYMCKQERERERDEMGKDEWMEQGTQ